MKSKTIVKWKNNIRFVCLGGVLIELMGCVLGCNKEEPSNPLWDFEYDTSDSKNIENDSKKEDDSDNVDQRFSALTAAFKNELEASGASGAAMAVIEGGEITFAQGFGTKYPDGDEEVKTTTLFRIASMTKMLTAAAVLQRVEAGELDLDAPITDYIPYLDFDLDNSWASSITGQHLLTHSSGIFDYLEVNVANEEKTDGALSEYVAGDFGSEHYLMAPSGLMWNYSNPNYNLAGLLVEQITGSYYAEYMDQEIFTPLGMDRTFFLPEQVLDDGDWAYGLFPSGESDSPPELLAPDAYDNGWGRPCAFAFSSVLDLASWVKFLRAGNETVLANNLLEAMVSKQKNMQTFLDLMAYGYGLIVTDGLYIGKDFYDLRVIEHDGAMPGFASEFRYVPELDFAMITLAGANGAYFPNSFAVAFETLCDLPTIANAPDLTMKPAELYDSFAGEYQDPFGMGQIIVTREGDNLIISLPDADDLDIVYEPELYPLSPNNFLLQLEGSFFGVTFIYENESDAVAKYFRTRYFVAQRIDERNLRKVISPINRLVQVDRIVRNIHLNPPRLSSIIKEAINIQGLNH